MKRSTERRSKRWVLRELDRCAAARATRRGQHSECQLTEASGSMPVPSTATMPSDMLAVEHRAGHRTEYFSKDGEPWIRDTLDGHILEIRVHEFLKMPISAYIQHMGADHSAAQV